MLNCLCTVERNSEPELRKPARDSSFGWGVRPAFCVLDGVQYYFQILVPAVGNQYVDGFSDGHSRAFSSTPTTPILFQICLARRTCVGTLSADSGEPVTLVLLAGDLDLQERTRLFQYSL